MSTASTASQKVLAKGRNPIPGPAEIQAGKGEPKYLAKPKYVPPRGRSRMALTPPMRSPHAHPMMKNLRDRRNEMMEITPDKAEEVLEYWNPRNRPFLPETCRRITEDISNDRFCPDNGETISFDFDGNLVDGMHRLTAIVRTGIPQRLLVVTGLDPKVRPTVNTGTSRTLTQILGMSGVGHPDGVGRAARLLIVYEAGKLDCKYHDILASDAPTKTATLEYIAEHAEELGQAVLMAMDKTFLNPFIKTGGVNTFCVTLFNRQDPDLARLFMYQLKNGLNSPTDTTGLDATHPVFLLRAVLTDNLGNSRKLKMTHIMALILKVWIAVRDKKPIKLLKIHGSERFPDLDENWPPESN